MLNRGRKAKKILLPQLVLTEVATATDEGATQVSFDVGNEPTTSYYRKRKLVEAEFGRNDGLPCKVLFQANLFPVVLDAQGCPWAEAVMYLLSRLEQDVTPVMTTYASLADDLAAYRQFLDEYCIDWTHFPSQKLSRPTYRFKGHLKLAVAAEELASGTARRRIGTVIRFYRWLIDDEKVFTPEHPPWKEAERYFEFRNETGFSFVKKVRTTDISIMTPKQVDPYDGMLDDGGRLRPLSMVEQEWLLDALLSTGNTEMTLIHLFGLLTGARIQTILTFQVRHAMLDLSDISGDELRFPVGPGTGIDTKNNKRLVLHIPTWFYRMLQTYAKSQRGRTRRERAIGGDGDNQYLFLSARGTPFFQSKAHSSSFDPGNTLRHQKTGQAVRQFITEKVIPFICSKYQAPRFHYQFHDTRATAGMNWTDHQLILVEQGLTTLKEAREFVKTRMGHASAAVTDRYLQYRRNLKQVRWATEEYECHLKALAGRAMDGLL
jgi:integrase